MLDMLITMLCCVDLTRRYVGRLLILICIISYAFSMARKALFFSSDLEAHFLSPSKFSTKYLKVLDESVRRHESTDCSLTSNGTTKIPRIYNKPTNQWIFLHLGLEPESCKRMDNLLCLVPAHI
ncbi:uncharacterized protein P174DRAFT_473819 [Aspergillus novofumigatus IBT 16806]|uniref:Uncharacterized protein n=1 Tax=Aspergillus novofumigatus (strain IBT 16806) TaxID=1392255 RepID=A0A2I1BSP4_ASPN1|nr:uncharacterized protein P174DRAFT_473819 [Aspergillus novofumigatus IBT 16806]PKX88382.1 hypothetical protein P174DRAFT_473819 [Aspergillus novofumigatus IBT 16806]